VSEKQRKPSCCKQLGFYVYCIAGQLAVYGSVRFGSDKSEFAALFDLRIGLLGVHFLFPHKKRTKESGWGMRWPQSLS